MAMKSPLNHDAADLIARRFSALSDPTRLRVLDLCDNVCAGIEAQLAQLGAVLSG